MDRTAIEQLLINSLHDGRMSRAERASLQDVLQTEAEDSHERDWLRSRIFAIARDRLIGPDAVKTVDWLDAAAGLLVLAERTVYSGSRPIPDEVLFSPGESCRLRIQELIRNAASTVDICVFTITDDRIAEEILNSFRRGVKVRVISDNEKTSDPGNDLMRLRQSGVPIVLDNTPHHMHHKFAVFDDTTVATGSYNWTRSAASGNHENIVIMNHPAVVRQFQKEFHSLWQTYSVEPATGPTTGFAGNSRPV